MTTVSVPGVMGELLFFLRTFMSGMGCTVCIYAVFRIVEWGLFSTRITVCTPTGLPLLNKKAFRFYSRFLAKYVLNMYLNEISEVPGSRPFCPAMTGEEGIGDGHSVVGEQEGNDGGGGLSVGGVDWQG